jgi:uncharacterized membrane protein YphA (DoxX/SURF4 family)
MKFAVRIVQVLVSILFIISGLVKANDPLGLSYKMQEFFELWNTSLSGSHFFAKQALISSFDYFHEHSLFLSVLMITLEIVTGIALLLGWMKKPVLYLLLLLIIFFTFLTGYAYLSGKFTNCGCFGDCLPITPFTSFLKDLILLVLIIFLIIGQKYIQPLFTKKLRTGLLIGSLALSLLLQWYVLNYLPLVDCLPFKKKNNIAEQMKPPPGAVPDSIAIRFIYEKGGKRYEFAPENLPADFTTYKYIDRIDKLVRKGNAEPRIKGFSLTTVSNEDSTQIILNQPKAILVFAQNEDNKDQWLKEFGQVVQEAQRKMIPVYFATSVPEKMAKTFSENGINVQIFACDFTVIRTAARVNPTLYILEKGTIAGKYGYRNFSEADKEIKKR